MEDGGVPAHGGRPVSSGGLPRFRPFSLAPAFPKATLTEQPCRHLSACAGEGHEQWVSCGLTGQPNDQNS